MRSTDVGRVATIVGIVFGCSGMGAASVAVVLPDIAAEYDVGTAQVAWVITLYALTMAVGTAVHGRIADTAGIRLPLVVGIGLMAGSAVLGALAPTHAVLLGSRLVQGVGAAAGPVLAVAVVSGRYSGARRTAALSRVAGTAAAISGLSPLVGGLLADVAGWRPVVALPALGLLAIPLLWSTVPTQGSGARFDVFGATTVATTAAGLVLLGQSPASGVVVAVVGGAMVAVGAPAAATRIFRRPDGFLPLQVIREADVIRSALVASAVPAAWFALLLVVPAVLSVRGWSALGIGLALLPGAAAAAMAPLIARPVLERLRPKRSLVVAGLGAAAALALASTGVSLSSPVALVVAFVVVNAAFGLGQPALMESSSVAVATEMRGVALGVAMLIFLLGGGFGSALVGGLGAVIGLGRSLLALAVLPLLGAAAMLHSVRIDAKND